MNKNVAMDLIKEAKQLYLFNSIPINIIHPNEFPIDLSRVVNSINQMFSSALFSNIEGIYIGSFPVLKDRNINAMFGDNAIYVSNKLSDENLMVTDIVHELSHSLEEEFGYDIYADGEINREFVAKRLTLYSVLKKNDIDVSLAARAFLYTEFDQVFDDFLYKTVGYEKLSILTANFLLSSYSATSLSEYFAIGFERFFLHPDDRHVVKEMCPKLYKRLIKLYKKNGKSK